MKNKATKAIITRRKIITKEALKRARSLVKELIASGRSRNVSEHGTNTSEICSKTGATKKEVFCIFKTAIQIEANRCGYLTRMDYDSHDEYSLTLFTES